MIGVPARVGVAAPVAASSTGSPGTRPSADSGVVIVRCPVTAGRELSHGRSSMAACASVRSTPLGRSSPPVRASWAAWSITDHIAAATAAGASVVNADMPSAVG